MQSFQLKSKHWDEEPLDQGALDLLLYKWKCYLGSVNRAIINKRLKENEKMALIYKCDKCGKELTYKETTKIIYEGHEDKDPLYEGYDFCKECSKKFLKWVKEKN